MAYETSDDPRGTTPEKWQKKEDPRHTPVNENLLYTWKCRSGHVETISSAPGNEYWIRQHRTGSLEGFMPDGSMWSVANRGRYDEIYGEHRQKITGASDRRIDGDRSELVKGNGYTTTHGNEENTIRGMMTQTARNMSFTSAQGFDVVSGHMAVKTENSLTVQAQGALSLLSAKGAVIGSSGDAAVIAGKTGVAVRSGADIAFDGKGKISFSNDSGAQVVFVGDKVYINSGVADKSSTIPLTQVEPAKPEAVYTPETPIS